jgi:CheY-like chemotaxis protein
MEKPRILWVDDEIDLLKPHILFISEKGYDLETATNGADALDMIEEKRYDLVFLDENMPGISGIETLQQIREMDQNLPVVMVTKSEEEHIMEDAIGAQIADYLIKPVNPNQLLLSIKKNLDKNRLVSEKTTSNYQQEFRKIGMELNNLRDVEDWVEMYKKLVYWEMELDKLDDESMKEILSMQKNEANVIFSKFIEKNYLDWMQGDEDGPVFSPSIFKKNLFPLLKEGKKVMVVLIDNLRYDQWKVIQPIFQQYFRMQEENMFFSILPTATQYARNSIFAGLMPAEIKKRFPDKWFDDTDDEGKNLYEEDFLLDNLKRNGLGYVSLGYYKITNNVSAKKLADSYKTLLGNQLNVVVYNFVDMLSHAKTDTRLIQELADDDKAYRSLTMSWFKNSPLLDLLRKISSTDTELILTTDHGTINVEVPTKLVGLREITTNLRYKQGKNMSYEKKDVFEINKPELAHLPKVHISANYVFAKERMFFAYPNNYNHFVKYYKNTFQHGGISLEEMIIPIVHLSPRN